MLRLYMKYFTMHVKSILQYKKSFLLTAIGQFLTSFTMFLGVYFMFQRFSLVEGFTYSQVLLCFSIALIEFSIAECFARGFDTFSSMLGNGEFDRIMVRPRNEIFQVLGSKIEFTRVGRLLQAVVMLVYGIKSSGIMWTGDKIAVLLFMIAGGTVVFTGIFIVYAALCFFTTENLEFMNIFTDGAREYGKYPISIYGKRVLQFCTFIIPLALVQYYPLLYLIGRESKDWYFFAPLVACLFFLPCLIIWKTGLKHYKSTGS